MGFFSIFKSSSDSFLCEIGKGRAGKQAYMHNFRAAFFEVHTNLKKYVQQEIVQHRMVIKTKNKNKKGKH